MRRRKAELNRVTEELGILNLQQYTLQRRLGKLRLNC